MKLTRAAWMEIDLDKLSNNIKTIRDNLESGTKIISVVKSNAYGFGAIKIVGALIKEGIDYFAVATLNEALELRREYKDIDILILGYTHDYLLDMAVKSNIDITITDFNQAKVLNNIAKELNVISNIHIAIDTGMNRIGFKYFDNAINEIESISRLSNISIKGIFTHFLASDKDETRTREQFNEFKNILDELSLRNVDVGLRHICNSTGILNYKEYNLDAVRPGIIQYGSTENIKSKYTDFNISYIGEIKALVSNVKIIKKGETVSYGGIFKAERDTQIVTIPIGYADGFIRILSGKLEVLIKGKRYKQVGRICMDQMMIDATGADVKIGDEVVLLGSSGNEKISISEISNKAGEIDTSYSCHFNRRLPRVYFKNKKICEVVDEVLS